MVKISTAKSKGHVKWLLVGTLTCGIFVSAMGFYNPNIGRWTTRDPMFTHSGFGKILLLNSGLSANQITELPRLNWAENGSVVAHGCNSGIWDANGDSVAGSFANGQGVPALGQTGFSQFSERSDRRTIFSRVGSDSKTVYLWSYGDGGRTFTYGAARAPRIFHPKNK